MSRTKFALALIDDKVLHCEADLGTPALLASALAKNGWAEIYEANAAGGSWVVSDRPSAIMGASVRHVRHARNA
ncbi:hypothetical protein ACFPFW_12695 [Flaviflagellibacter deserti]|uniref:Uncharacterized protein n=2 Tax=Flaviflagellibacter deserti TaxID=2267266 RepID=A0ABV9Z274_9HYPH